MLEQSVWILVLPHNLIVGAGEGGMETKREKEKLRYFRQVP